MPLRQDNTNKNKNTMTPNIIPLRRNETTPTFMSLRKDNTNKNKNKNTMTPTLPTHVTPNPDLFGDDPTRIYSGTILRSHIFMFILYPSPPEFRVH